MKQRAHPWEEPHAPSVAPSGRLFRWGLTAPDVSLNPALWPFAWIYGKLALRRARRLASQARRILDIRCGSGWLLWELAKVAPQAHLVGLDTRLRPLTWGQLQSESRLGPAMGKVELLEKSLLDYEAAPESFDLILCNFAFTRVEEAAPWLEKVQKLLKPGGHVYYYDATEPTALTVDRLASWYRRRTRWSGGYTDLWSLRRRVRAEFADDPLRRLRHPKAASEGEIWSCFQSMFEVLEQGRIRSITDLWLNSLPTRGKVLWLPLLLALDRLTIALGWLEGCRRYAWARKPAEGGY
jgi:SAM-dependent methyltransferase